MASHRNRYRALASLLLVALSACHRERRLESFVPPDTTVLAGADLDRIRSWVPDTFREATNVVVAFNGKDLLFLLRGNFTQAPMGGTLVNPHFALVGPPDAVRAAIEHPSASCPLCDRAPSPRPDVWAVMRGGGPLPLGGNAANVNHLLRLTDWLSAGATAGQKFDIEITAYCRSGDAASQFEETLRATLTLANIDTADVNRDGLTVRIKGSASPELVGRLLR